MVQQDEKFEKITLLKLLVNSNIGSRRYCFKEIISGMVQVNDKVIVEPKHSLKKQDKVYYDNTLVKFNRAVLDNVYIMLNKPQGYICSVTDEGDKPSILNLIRHRDLKKKHLFPVGRLDFLTEGLIFITNDGEFSNFVLKAANKIPKFYYVEIKGMIKQQDIEKIKKGIHTRDESYTVSGVELIEAGSKKSKLSIILTEGKNREIRNIFLYLRYKIKLLKRYRIGPFKLDSKLETGQYTLLAKKSINDFMESVKKHLNK